MFIYLSSHKDTMAEDLKILLLTKNNMKLLFEIGKKNEVTANGQTTCTPLSFYVNSKTLKQLGLIQDRPLDDYSLIKLWTVTEKGSHVLYHLKKIEGML